MIEIKNLTKEFPGVIAVNNLSLDVKPGINGLIGENGAGKSTLLRLIADVFQVSSGEILIDGKHHYEPEVKNSLFFLSDNPYFSTNMTPKEVVELYASLFDVDQEKFYSILNHLSLPTERRLSTYSKGMRRQLFLALSLSMKAEYILLDEAFDGLDPIVQDIVKQEIIENASSKTFIMSSHNLLSLERLCDNFILLSKGRCTKNGGLEDMGKNFKKFQIIFKQPVNKENLTALGVKVISFKTVGSIYYVVVDGEEDERIIKEKLEPTLMESVAIDTDELITLEMIAQKEANK